MEGFCYESHSVSTLSCSSIAPLTTLPVMGFWCEYEGKCLNNAVSFNKLVGPLTKCIIWENVEISANSKLMWERKWRKSQEIFPGLIQDYVSVNNYFSDRPFFVGFRQNNIFHAPYSPACRYSQASALLCESSIVSFRQTSRSTYGRITSHHLARHLYRPNLQRLTRPLKTVCLRQICTTNAEEWNTREFLRSIERKWT